MSCKRFFTEGCCSRDAQFHEWHVRGWTNHKTIVVEGVLNDPQEFASNTLKYDKRIFSKDKNVSSYFGKIQIKCS